MSEKILSAEEQAAADAAKTKADADAKAAADAKPQTPIDIELDKQKKPKRTELEKAEFAQKKIKARISALKGENPDDDEEDEDDDLEDDDDKPVTVGMLKKLEVQKAQQTALQIAESIADSKERELAKHYLTSVIKPSTDPEADVKYALSLVNAAKNGQIVQELSRKGPASSHSSGSGAPPKPSGEVFEPTPAEASMMAFPFNLTQAEVIAARKKEEEAG